MSLKLLVDTKGQIVLYAEDSFVDFLFNLLSLLVGTVVKLLIKQGTVGSLANHYENFESFE